MEFTVNHWRQYARKLLIEPMGILQKKATIIQDKILYLTLQKEKEIFIVHLLSSEEEEYDELYKNLFLFINYILPVIH